MLNETCTRQCSVEERCSGRRGWLLRTIVVQVVFCLPLCIWVAVWTRYCQLCLLGVGMRRVAQFGVGLSTCSMSSSLVQFLSPLTLRDAVAILAQELHALHALSSQVLVLAQHVGQSSQPARA